MKKSIPKYKIIADDIEKQVKEGVLRSGEPMNSELKTQQQYDVSRVTVRKAYKLLLDKGIIRTVHGVGTFINDLYNKDWTWMNSFTSQVSRQGHVPTTKIKNYQVIETNSEISQHLNIKENEECILLERIRYIDNQPIWISKSYISTNLVPGFSKDFLSVAGAAQSIFRVLEINYNITCSKRLMLEENAYVNEKAAKIFDVEADKKLLKKKSIAFDGADSPIVYEETIMLQKKIDSKSIESNYKENNKNIKIKGALMKVCVHMSMFCKTWSDDIIPYLNKVKELGFDGAEISLFGNSDEKINDALSCAKDLGLDVICGTGVSAECDPSSEDENVRQKAIDYLKECVDKVAFGNGKNLNGVLYAPWQGFSQVSKQTRWNNASNVLKEVGSYAKKKNITLNIEVINRFETDFFNTIDEAVEFLKLVDLDNVKLLVDTFHMNIEEDDIYSALEKNISYIGCVHVSENHRGVPGTGHIDWKKIISILKKNQYEGYLDMETFVESGTEVGNALFIWNGKDRRPFDEAEKGLKYLQSLIGVKNRYKNLASNLNKVFDENSQYLCKLDGEAGDGDHGTTIARGFKNAFESVSELDDSSSAHEVFKAMGYAMLKNMGGASGPIFSSLFIQLATLLNGEKELNAQIYKKSIEDTINVIHELTGTNRGEKTMMDALYGAKDACDSFNGDDLVELMEIAKDGAHEGSLATQKMKATKGRAKFLQERSIGSLDAGSHSVYLILNTFLETWR
ncbi:MAG: dihydroxyacetone kinase subunit DhaL [Pleomorphochaeta sp.]